MSVISNHNAGFFSCCSVKLNDIIDYINLNSKLPDYVDSSSQFKWYKKENRDITYEYFEHYNNVIINPEFNYPIHYNYENQFIDYSKLDYNNIISIVHKYFTPSKLIINIIQNMQNKYKLIYDNICVLFYRGNDKGIETKLCSYDEYLVYANLIMKSNPNIVFLIQSDETEFIIFMTLKFPNNSFYFKDEIRHTKKCNSTVDYLMQNKNYIFSKYYLAITIIMSKCKYIICGSGNCSLWIMLYRGNAINVFQNCNKQWLYQTVPAPKVFSAEDNIISSVNLGPRIKYGAVCRPFRRGIYERRYMTNIIHMNGLK